MPSLLKWVWKNAVELKFKESSKIKNSSEKIEVIHEKCFNLIKQKKEIKKNWKIISV